MRRAGAARPGGALGWILAGALCLSACGPASPRAPAPAPKGAPDQVIEDFSIDGFSGPQRDWTLRSPLARVFEKDHRIELRTPSVQFFEQDRPSSTLDAGAGRIDTESRDIWAWDGVVMASTDGARLTSDWMLYRRSDDRIVSTAPVTIVRGGSVINGVGWEATPDLSAVSVLRQQVEISTSDASTAGRVRKGRK